MRFRHFILRDSFLSTILKCPQCRGERHETRGIIQLKGYLQEMCYLGCECPAPKGVMKV